MLPTAALTAVLLAFQGAAAPTTPPAQTPAPQTPISTSVVPAAKPAPDKVVATIDGKPVTAGEIEGYLWAWKVRDTVREYANYQMIANEAAKKGVSVSDEEIRTKIDTLLASVKANLQPGQTVETLLSERGIDPTRVALSARSEILLDKIAALDFKPEDYVKVDSIAFPVGTGADAEARSLRAANTAYAALNSGKTWDVVLKANTTPPQGTAQSLPGGWVPIAALPETVRPQIATLKPMGVAKPTPTPSGAQIFRLLDRGTNAKPADLEPLRLQFVGNARNAIIQRLQTTTKIEYKQ